MRRLLTVLLLALLGLAAPAASQQSGGSEAPPTELWKEYPLETVPSAPSNGRDAPPSGQDGGAPAEETPRESATESSPASEGDDDGPMETFALIAIVLLVLVASAGIARLGLNARRSRPAPAASAPAAGAEVRLAQANGATADPPGKARPAPAVLPAAAQPEPPAAKAATPDPEPATEREPAPEPEPVATDAAATEKPSRGNGHRPSEPMPQIAAQPQAVAEPAAASALTRQISPENERALGYTTVARPEDAESQLRAEARQIQLACKKRGMRLKKLVRDLESQGGADLTRPGLSFALERLGNGEYTCLVVTSLDRLTRSAANLGTLIYRLEEHRTRLVVVDIDLDTGTEEGRLAARALVKVSGLERGKLEGQGRRGHDTGPGKRRSSGRPAVADRPTLRRRIAEMRTGGMTLQAIADTLNEEGVPTLRGGAQWRPSSVQAAAGYKRPPRKTGAKARKGGNGSNE